MSLTSRAVHWSSSAISSGERLAAELLHELALDVHDLVELLDHVDGNADRPALSAMARVTAWRIHQVA